MIARFSRIEISSQTHRRNDPQIRDELVDQKGQQYRGHVADQFAYALAHSARRSRCVAVLAGENTEDEIGEPKQEYNADYLLAWCEIGCGHQGRLDRILTEILHSSFHDYLPE